MAYKESFVKYSKGAVLVVVLLLCMVMALFSNAMFDSAILQQKMVNHYQEKLWCLREAELELIKLEQHMESQFVVQLQESVSLIQFVPDTLHVGEKFGTRFYQIQVEKNHPNGASVELLSTIAVANDPSNLPDIQETAFNLDIPENLVISSITAIADYVYLTDNQGQLWKINRENVWKRMPMNGTIIGKPVVGRHPGGVGVLVYVLVVDEAQNSIVALSDNFQDPIFPFFTIVDKNSLSEPKLRQGYLVVNSIDDDTFVKIYNAFNGRLIREKRIQSLQPFSENPHDNKRPPPVIMINKPREKEREVYVYTKKGIGFVKIEIDYDRLGRKTWVQQ